MSDSGDSDLLHLFESRGLPNEAILDPFCLVNAQNHIIYANAAMKSLLNLRKREIDAKPIFCDLIKLSACKDGCEITKAINFGKALRLDEVPATRGESKMRIILRVIPLLEKKGPANRGAIITLRDTTADVVVQAKYHKLMEMIQGKNEKIEDLEYKLLELRAKVSRFSKIAR